MDQRLGMNSEWDRLWEDLRHIWLDRIGKLTKKREHLTGTRRGVVTREINRFYRLIDHFSDMEKVKK